MTSPFACLEAGDGLELDGPTENAVCEPTHRIQPEWKPVDSLPLPIDLVPFALTWDFIIPSIALVDGSTFCPV
jgi:hypothetical protein